MVAEFEVKPKKINKRAPSDYEIPEYSHESKTKCISLVYVFARRKQNAFRWYFFFASRKQNAFHRYIFLRVENKMHFAGIYFHQTKTEGKWGQGGGIDTRYLIRININ